MDLCFEFITLCQGLGVGSLQLIIAGFIFFQLGVSELVSNCSLCRHVLLCIKVQKSEIYKDHFGTFEDGLRIVGSDLVGTKRRIPFIRSITRNMHRMSFWFPLPLILPLALFPHSFKSFLLASVFQLTMLTNDMLSTPVRDGIYDYA